MTTTVANQPLRINLANGGSMQVNLSAFIHYVVKNRTKDGRTVWVTPLGSSRRVGGVAPVFLAATMAVFVPTATENITQAFRAKTNILAINRPAVSLKKTTRAIMVLAVTHTTLRSAGFKNVGCTSLSLKDCHTDLRKFLVNLFRHISVLHP